MQKRVREQKAVAAHIRKCVLEQKEKEFILRIPLGGKVKEDGKKL